MKCSLQHWKFEIVIGLELWKHKEVLQNLTSCNVALNLGSTARHGGEEEEETVQDCFVCREMLIECAHDFG